MNVVIRFRLRTRALTLVAMPTVCIACGGDSSTAPPPVPATQGLRIVAGSGLTDTIEAQVTSLLTVEVRQPSGSLAIGTLVRFQAKVVGDSIRRVSSMTVCPRAEASCLYSRILIVDTTDTQGLARVRVRFGSVAGRAQVRITVPDYGLVDSATYAVAAGAPARIVKASADTGLTFGESALLRGSVTDRLGNVRVELPQISGASDAASIDTLTGVVTGRAFGAQWVLLRYQTLTDSTWVRAFPAGRLVAWSKSTEKISLTDVNGRNRRAIASDVRSVFGAFPQFDPSRQRLTFHRSIFSASDAANVVSVLDTTGNVRREILQADGFTRVLTTRALADGALLVVARRTGVVGPGANGDGFGVWRVAVDGAITFVAGIPSLSTVVGSTDLSHDGTRVAFSALSPTGGGELRVLNFVTGAVILVAPNCLGSPRWSPQDDRIAFLAGVPDYAVVVSAQLSVAGADGSGRRQLSSDVFATGIAWSPDGAYLIASSLRDPVGLRMIRVSDGATVALRFSEGSFNQFDWR